MNKYVVNSHGELLDELGPGDRILRAKSIEYLNGVMDFEGGSFVKGGVDEMLLLMRELSIQEKAFILSVVPYVSYVDCKLRWPQTNHELNLEHLLQITGMGKSSIYRVVKDLKEKKILYGKYHLNPWLFFRGNKMDPRLKEWFGEYRVRSKGGVAWQEL